MFVLKCKFKGEWMTLCKDRKVDSIYNLKKEIEKEAKYLQLVVDYNPFL